MEHTEEATKHPVLEHYREFLKGGPPPATDFQPRPEPTEQEFVEWLSEQHPTLYARWMAGPRQLPGPFICNAEEIVTLYGALSTYLTVLAQQPDKDLETIARVTRLMIAIKPQAVEASQEIQNRNTAS